MVAPNHGPDPAPGPPRSRAAADAADAAGPRVSSLLLLGGSVGRLGTGPWPDHDRRSGFGPTEVPSRAAVGNDGENQLNGVSLGGRAGVGART